MNEHFFITLSDSRCLLSCVLLSHPDLDLGSLCVMHVLDAFHTICFHTRHLFFQMWIFKVYIQCNCTLTQSCAAVKNVEIIECLKNNKVIKKIFSDASEIVFKVSNCEINWT